MRRGLHEKHPGIETLHAFAAGEVPPGPVHTAIGAHVARCAECAASLARVSAVRNMLATPPEPIDDLRWARLQRRVQAELRAPAPTDRRFDLRDWARWWAPGAVVVATCLATVLVVNAWPRGATMPITQSPTVASADQARDRARDARVDVAGSVEETEASALPPIGPRADGAPVDVTLESGVTLRLGPSAEVRLAESRVDRVSLELVAGEIEVASSETPRAVQIELRAPDLLATADGSARFRVARLADAPTAFEIERGEVKVARAGVSTVEGSPPRAAGKRDRTAPHATASATPAATPASVASEPAPLTDPWERTLAAYEAGQLDEAVVRARAILGGQTDQATARRAWNLICDAQLALDRPRDAADACEQVLPLIGGDEARLIRFRIATIYRARLRDCARATFHYDRMVVVGSSAIIDQDALLGRAECALVAQDLDGASRDLGFLRGQSLARPTAYAALVERLRQARETQKNTAGKP